MAFMQKTKWNIFLPHQRSSFVPGTVDPQEEESYGGGQPHHLQLGWPLSLHDAGRNKKYNKNQRLRTVRLFHDQRYRDKVQVSLQAKEPVDVHERPINTSLRPTHLQIQHWRKQALSGEQKNQRLYLPGPFQRTQLYGHQTIYWHLPPWNQSIRQW